MTTDTTRVRIDTTLGAIELELDMSHRTLARRISELMKRFGATTRCQLGWLAAQRATGTTIK